jgi:1-aminocyclopropane-1-carboxylate deaminase/D-cysteine desulfhydrase-like pyridoxal-dependent ACC family enzyme
VIARDNALPALRSVARARLATVPTPLEEGPELPGGARLFAKRDDLTGLGMGGNKARKLEYLCADARAQGADALVTVGAAQSNHARTTAAAAAVLGLEAHLVLGGEPTTQPAGNQLLSHLFGAHMHFARTDDWAQLGLVLDDVAAKLRAQGRRPYRIPMGGSTALGALGFAAAWIELMQQCDAAGIAPAAVVHASSTGGTHAGLLAGRAAWRAAGLRAPRLVGIAVAKGVGDLAADTLELARGCLDLLGSTGVDIAPEDFELDWGWLGPAYAVPTLAADAATEWAARRAAWVLDRVYTAKAFAGLLAMAQRGEFARGEAVVFWHTGGIPAVFAPGGARLESHISMTQEFA